DAGKLRLGQAEYECLIVPACLVLHEDTISALRRAHDAGVRVSWTETPAWMQTESGLRPFQRDGHVRRSIDETGASLARLLPLEGDTRDLRCTAWQEEQGVAYLLMNLRQEKLAITLDRSPLVLNGGEVRVLHFANEVAR